MQNQLQYPQSFPSQSNNNGTAFQKLGSPTHFKTQDRTLPSPNIKHYSSNPNLSLELGNIKTSQTTMDSQQLSSNHIKKNLQYRSPPSHNQYAYSQQTPSRGVRGQMSQSLIVGDQNNAEVPQEVQNPKKQMFRNIPKRSYRMSETI